MDEIGGWVVREFGPKDAARTALFLPGALASHVFIEDVAAVPKLKEVRLVATTLPANAYFATGDQKYKKWVVTYVDGWLERMKQNNGIIPTFVDLDGKVGGPTGKWWGSAYGWGFSPVNPVTKKRENRNRMERPIIGLNNALLLTGDQKYVDAWRDMTTAINANARTVDGKTQYPTMYGLDLAANPRSTKPGWYGWRDRPWTVGALEV